MDSKCPDTTLRMRRMYLNLCILRMLEDTFSFQAATLILESQKKKKKKKKKKKDICID